MINELLKPLLLETEVAKPSEGELLRMHDKAKSSGEESNHQKGFLFAICIVLKSNHVMQFDIFPFCK
jgi:hypothetical protein